MTIEEQAAMYMTGVSLSPVEEMQAKRRIVPGDQKHSLKRLAYKQSGAIFRGTTDHEKLVEYAQMDVDLVMAFFRMSRQRERLAAQRPLIHNGKKMKR